MNIYKRFSPRTVFKSSTFNRVLIILMTFILLVIISSRNILPEKYNLREGDVAPSDINAPRDFVDYDATEARREEAAKAVPDIFTIDLFYQREAIKKINSYFEAVKEVQDLNIDHKEKVSRLSQILTLSIDDYNTSLTLGNDAIKALSAYLNQEITKVLSKEIKDNNDKATVLNELSERIRTEQFPKDTRELAVGIVYKLVQVNTFKDEEKMHTEREKVRRSVNEIVVKKGQNIVNKGEVIKESHIELMRIAGLLQKNYTVDIAIYSGISLLTALLIVLAGWLLKRFARDVYNDNSKLLIISIIVCINTLFIMGLNVISGYLIPMAFTAILLSLMFEPITSMIVAIFTIVTTACITGFNYEIIILTILSSFGGILFSYKANQRNNVLFSGVSIGIFNALVILSFGLINNISIAYNALHASQGIAAGILSAVLAIGILPLFEQMFDIITPIKLLELSNPNHPLLKKMLFEAPGTYHHSILVGNLSEAASEEVGANSLLARVGSYYHDIGKIKRPYFFKENQITNDNPHDKITPKLSTLIITSHVKDGIEMAQKYKLPGEIKDIIAEHHGTTLVKYFYVMALNDGSEVVEENSFRYEGPIPQSREAAIVMLADSLEAAVRSLNNPTIGDIENMVGKIVKDKIEDGQLDTADLTLREIEKIKKAFIRVLQGIFHTRIEYPEIDGSTKERKNSDD